MINRKTKKIILLELKGISDCGDSYFKDMWRVVEKLYTPIMTGLRSLTEERGWEVAVVPLVAGQRGRTILDDHEKLFGSYWWHTFGPSRSLM